MMFDKQFIYKGQPVTFAEYYLNNKDLFSSGKPIELEGHEEDPLWTMKFSELYDEYTTNEGLDVEERANMLHLLMEDCMRYDSNIVQDFKDFLNLLCDDKIAGYTKPQQ